MLRRRPEFASLVSLVLLSFLAASGVPRDAWYAHRHAGDAHGHAHAWDATRVGGSTASVRDLAGHRHDHAHEHGSEHAERAHPHPHEHGLERVGRDRVADAPGQHDAAARHAGAAAGARAAGGPGLAAPGDVAHAHWQAPFQTVAAAPVAAGGPPALHARHPGTAPVAAPTERARALRARSPPASPV